MLSTIFKFIAGVLVAPGIFMLHAAGYQINKTQVPVSVVPQTTQPTFGDFNPTGGGTYYLASSISSTQNTVTLSSFTEPTSNLPYTMSYLNSSIEYATIAPQTTQSEFISFTGITQNSDGSATLTGVTRGLARSYPYTASTTLSLAHAGQTRFILSNPPQLTNQYANLNNQSNILNVWNFEALPTTTLTCTSPFQFCPKSYIDAGLNQGAATSTFTNLGLVWLATPAQTAAGTASSTTGAPLVIPNKNASSTYNGSTVFQGEIPALRSTKDIDPNFIATSSGNNYNWMGTTTLATTTMASTTVTGVFTVTGTSTFANANGTSTVAGNFTIAKNASTTNLVISGTCSKGNGQGCNQVTSTSSISTALTSGNSARTTVTAICVSPQVVVGGGGSIVSGTPVAFIDTSYPSAAGTWTVIYQNGTTGFGGGGNVQAYALCINP